MGDGSDSESGPIPTEFRPDCDQNRLDFDSPSPQTGSVGESISDRCRSQSGRQLADNPPWSDRTRSDRTWSNRTRSLIGPRPVADRIVAGVDREITRQHRWLTALAIQIAAGAGDAKNENKAMHAQVSPSDVYQSIYIYI